MEGVVSKLDRITDEILNAQDARQRQVWVEKLGRCQEEKASIEQRIVELEERSRNHRSHRLDSGVLLKTLNDLTTNFSAMPFAAKHRLLTSIVSCVVVEKDQIRVNIVNPGFSVAWDRDAGVNLTGGGFAHWNGWLLRQDSNLRPGD